MSLRLDAAGETLWLLADGAVWWPRGRTVFVADLHLGKGAAFRAQGQPVPAGSSARTLARLQELVVRHDAAQLVVLGDFWHGAQGLTPALLDNVAEFARRVPTVLVLGNHDRRIHPAGLPLQAVSGALPLGPLTAAHEPPQPGTPGFTLAGHWHPAVMLGSRAGDRLRRPCFVRYPHALVLPAFGGLTGAMTLRRSDLARQDADVAVLGEGDVHWLPRVQACKPALLEAPPHLSFETATDFETEREKPASHSPHQPSLQFSLDGLEHDDSVHVPQRLPGEPPALRYEVFFAAFAEFEDAELLCAAGQRLAQVHGLRGVIQTPQLAHVTLCKFKGPDTLKRSFLAATVAVARGIACPALPVIFDSAQSFKTDGAFMLRGDAATEASVARLRGPLLKGLRRLKLRPEASAAHMTMVYNCGKVVARQTIEPLPWTIRRFALVISHIGNRRHEIYATWTLPSR